MQGQRGHGHGGDGGRRGQEAGVPPDGGRGRHERHVGHQGGAGVRGADTGHAGVENGGQ